MKGINIKAQELSFVITTDSHDKDNILTKNMNFELIIEKAT